MLLHLQDAGFTEVLDYFIHGLAPLVHAQVLGYDPADFERVALMAERVVGAHGKPTCHPDPPGYIPMDLGAKQEPSSYSGIHPRSGGNGSRSNDKQTYHCFNQPGYFILSCLKSKWDMEAKQLKAAGWFLM